MTYKNHKYIVILLLLHFKCFASAQYDNIYHYDESRSLGNVAHFVSDNSLEIIFDSQEYNKRSTEFRNLELENQPIKFDDSANISWETCTFFDQNKFIVVPKSQNDRLAFTKNVQQCCFLSIEYDEGEHILAHIDYRFFEKNTALLKQTLAEIALHISKADLYSGHESLLVSNLVSILHNSIGKEKTRIFFRLGGYFDYQDNSTSTHKVYIDSINPDMRTLFESKEKKDWLNIYFNNFKPLTVGLNAKTGNYYNSYPHGFFTNQRVRYDNYESFCCYINKNEAAKTQLEQSGSPQRKSLIKAFESLGLMQDYMI